MSACQSFRSVAPFFLFFWKKYHICFVLFFDTEKVWPYRHAYDIPLVTLILNIYIYGFVDLAPFFFLTKAPFLAFFNMQIDMLMTFTW